MPDPSTRRTRTRGVAALLLLAPFFLAPFCLALAAGAPSRPADAPPTLPTVDAAVRYHVAPSGRPAEDVTVLFGGDGRFLRVDGPPGEGATVLDRTARTVTVIVPDPHVYFVVPLSGPVTDPFMLGPGMRFRRAGTAETIAGEPCDDWLVATGRGDATACVTATGLLLRADGVDGTGASGRLRALSVSLAPLAADRFAPPEGWRRIAHPAGR